MEKNNKSPLYKVYYSKGADQPTFTAYSLEDVGNTPIFEVLVIVEFDNKHGRKLVSSGDYYIWQDKRWIACDSETRNMYMARKGMEKRYLIGVMVGSDEWTEAMKLARNDPDFPTQTALHLYESKEGFE